MRESFVSVCRGGSSSDGQRWSWQESLKRRRSRMQCERWAARASLWYHCYPVPPHSFRTLAVPCCLREVCACLRLHGRARCKSDRGSQGLRSGERQLQACVFLKQRLCCRGQLDDTHSTTGPPTLSAPPIRRDAATTVPPRRISVAFSRRCKIALQRSRLQRLQNRNEEKLRVAHFESPLPMLLSLTLRMIWSRRMLSFEHSTSCV